MIGIAGAGTFGLALAVALGRDGREVVLWARDTTELGKTRRNEARLPGVVLPDLVSVRPDIDALRSADTVLLVVPMQALHAFLAGAKQCLDGLPLVACCKGVDLQSLRGPSDVIAEACPRSAVSVLTGPSFAADIARGLPTALTLAGGSEEQQRLLSTPVLRLYLSSDIVGAELGGALKNVIAIAAGVVIGAGLGESARAALMTRGFAEMQRFALMRGARAETLAGLSGFGDLVLTATSEQSRNFRFGLALGQGTSFDPTATVEGVATARAIAQIAARDGLDMPITRMIAALVSGEVGLPEAITSLMTRPLKKE